MTLSAVVYPGDCRDIMAAIIPADSVDSIVCDPPYGLSKEPDAAEVLRHWLAGDDYVHGSNGFMNRSWDSFVPGPATWREAYRVLKPGGYLVAFFGTRTYDLGVLAIRLAGFEIRDQVNWVFGCLDDQTQVVTERGVVPYHETTLNDRALCYDVNAGGYSYQPILERVEYDYDDTAYRISGDFGEQIVSKNHRVIVERGGVETFAFAETCEPKICVPFLEDLQGLQRTISNLRSVPSRKKRNLFSKMQIGSIKAHSPARKTYRCAKRKIVHMPRMRGGILEARRVVTKNKRVILQPTVQRGNPRQGMGGPCLQSAIALESGKRATIKGPNDRKYQSVLERRRDLPPAERKIRRAINSIRPLPGSVYRYGTKRRVRDGTPADRGAGHRSYPHTIRNRAPSKSQCGGQCTVQPNAFRNECGTQEVRAWAGHKTNVVRVVPFHLTGKVWCLRVPTGAFVAVRNGVAFPTGNSGFPKTKTHLKPAHEPIVIARKPLSERSVAANVLKWGTGAINIDGCRVGTESTRCNRTAEMGYHGGNLAQQYQTGSDAGRFPPNLLHDGSPEVLAQFPDAARFFPSCPYEEGDVPSFLYCPKASNKDRDEGLTGEPTPIATFQTANGTSGEASSWSEGRDTKRLNPHPTVKPTALMQWLVRLVTPPGGTVLDPFCGSGSTGKACMREGLHFIGCEMTLEYIPIAMARIEAAR